MNSRAIPRLIIKIYVGIFLFYMLAPLVVMGGAALNDSRFPSVFPWVGFTDRWFIDLWNDDRMLHAASNTVLIALSVVAITIPIGTAAAILINNVKGRYRSFLYGVMVAPILTPGAVIGISTLLFWNRFDVPAGLHLSTLGQCSFISAYVMLLVLARLQTFDPALEEAALDLGATNPQVENFNITLFTKGNSDTLTVYVGSKVRSGITPTINALALMLITLTVIGAIAYEISRRRAERHERALLEQKDEDDIILGQPLPAALGS
jgi:spermidine/putrescine transport system permease protein